MRYLIQQKNQQCIHQTIIIKIATKMEGHKSKKKNQTNEEQGSFKELLESTQKEIHQKFGIQDYKSYNVPKGYINSHLVMVYGNQQCLKSNYQQSYIQKIPDQNLRRRIHNFFNEKENICGVDKQDQFIPHCKNMLPSLDQQILKNGKQMFDEIAPKQLPEKFPSVYFISKGFNHKKLQNLKASKAPNLIKEKDLERGSQDERRQKTKNCYQKTKKILVLEWKIDNNKQCSLLLLFQLKQWFSQRQMDKILSKYLPELQQKMKIQDSLQLKQKQRQAKQDLNKKGKQNMDENKYKNNSPGKLKMQPSRDKYRSTIYNTPVIPPIKMEPKKQPPKQTTYPHQRSIIVSKQGKPAIPIQTIIQQSKQRSSMRQSQSKPSSNILSSQSRIQPNVQEKPQLPKPIESQSLSTQSKILSTQSKIQQVSAKVQQKVLPAIKQQVAEEEIPKRQPERKKESLSKVSQVFENFKSSFLNKKSEKPNRKNTQKLQSFINECLEYQHIIILVVVLAILTSPFYKQKLPFLNQNNSNINENTTGQTSNIASSNNQLTLDDLLAPYNACLSLYSPAKCILALRYQFNLYDNILMECAPIMKFVTSPIKIIASWLSEISFGNQDQTKNLKIKNAHLYKKKDDQANKNN